MSRAEGGIWGKFGGNFPQIPPKSETGGQERECGRTIATPSRHQRHKPLPAMRSRCAPPSQVALATLAPPTPHPPYLLLSPPSGGGRGGLLGWAGRLARRLWAPLASLRSAGCAGHARSTAGTRRLPCDWGGGWGGGKGGAERMCAKRGAAHGRSPTAGVGRGVAKPPPPRPAVCAGAHCAAPLRSARACDACLGWWVGAGEAWRGGRSEASPPSPASPPIPCDACPRSHAARSRTRSIPPPPPLQARRGGEGGGSL
jgi:hypothetical protein